MDCLNFNDVLHMLQINQDKNTERFNWLKLTRSENVGPKTFIKLIELYGSASYALEHIETLAANGGLNRKIKIPTDASISEEIGKTQEYGARIVLSCDKDYPHKLKLIDDHPAALIIKGSFDFSTNYQCVAIVGARNASANGCSLAKQIACDLGKEGIIISSGLALGIDTFAHRGSLGTGTVAVIAGGINNIYPPQNKALYEEIKTNGAIISELPIDCAPLAKHFPKRNRIISGLSDAVLVVEAALKSGSLITANIAKSQGKTIFAVPGTPSDLRHRGTNSLLRQGAKIAENAEDILSFLKSSSSNALLESGNTYKHPQRIIPPMSSVNKYREAFIQALTYSPTCLDEILTQTQIPINIAHVLILELELAGKLTRSFGNKVQLIVT